MVGHDVTFMEYFSLGRDLSYFGWTLHNHYMLLISFTMWPLQDSAADFFPIIKDFCLWFLDEPGAAEYNCST